MKSSLKTFAFWQLAVFLMCGPLHVLGNGNDSTGASSSIRKAEYGIDYFLPTYNHAIRSMTVDALFRKKWLKSADLNLDIGITATYAWGKIPVWNEMDSVYYWRATEAGGIGPCIHFEQTILRINDFFIGAEVSGGLQVYSKPFPKGADWYDFMFRAGGMIGYQVNQKLVFKMGCRWIHVSNGKGFGPQNPTYEGGGFNISVQHYFSRRTIKK